MYTHTHTHTHIQWTRGLEIPEKDVTTLVEFKKKLRWTGYDKSSKKWFDRSGIGMLFYAVCSNNVDIVREIITNLRHNFKHKKYTEILNARIPNAGFISLGLPGGMTSILAAMAFGSPEIVSVLIKNGASVTVTDSMGNDPFMWGSGLGRLDNLATFLHLTPNWNLERRNKMYISLAHLLTYLFTYVFNHSHAHSLTHSYAHTHIDLVVCRSHLHLCLEPATSSRRYVFC